jgi:hypothetical protein
MSFQAYLDTIHAKTGKRPEDIVAMVRAQRLSKPADVIAWVKSEFGLGHGHAMAIVSLLRRDGQPARSDEDKVTAYFSGAKARWRAAYDRLLGQVQGFGPDVAVSHGATYLSLVKGGRKFAIVQAVGERMDVGVKLKSAAPAGRLEEAGAWNAMVTHRVRIKDEAELDEEVLGCLREGVSPMGADRKWRVCLGWGMSALMILFMLFDSIAKLALERHVIEATSQIGYPQHAIRPLGAMALACTLLYAIPRTSVLGAILLTAYLGGAVASKVRIDDPLFSSTLFGVYFGILVWGGLYLRDERLRAMIPFRRRD